MGWWTPHARFNFGIAKGEPFSTSAIKWDPTWPADKPAYYNARKEAQEKGAAWEKENPNAKALQIAKLKKQLAALE